MPICRSKIVSAALFILATTAAVSADSLPNFDVGPTCRGATRPEAALRSGDAARKTCFNHESRARDELQKKWANFPADHRADCVRATSVGGILSYVQLQSCLESRRDAKRIEDGRSDRATTTGQGAISR